MAITNVSVARYTDGGMTQAGATTGRMSGTAGDRLGLLDSVLVNGYNWQELTPANLTQVGNVATITQAAHGFNIYQRLWIVGMDQQGYLNGTTYGDTVYAASVPTTGTLTFTVTGSPTSPATAAGSTTLGAAIVSTTATTITLTSGASFPNFPYVIKIDSEYMLVTAGFQTTTPTVIRGWAASTAATHLISTATTQKIMMGVAPAGGFTHWTKDYTTTNKSTYRMPGGNQRYFDLDDSNTTYGLVRGYGAMTGTATGTDPFPTTAQVAAGSTYFASSSSASTASRAWAVIATDRMVAVWTDIAGVQINQTNSGGFYFGDQIDKTKSGDVWATMMIHGANASGTSDPALGVLDTLAGQYVARAYTQIGTALNVFKRPLDGRMVAGSSTYSGGSGLTYPHPPDGGLYVTKFVVTDGTTSAVSRGTLPGIWCVMHVRPCQSFDVVPGTGVHAGKYFLMLQTYSGAQIAFEISNTIQDA